MRLYPPGFPVLSHQAHKGLHLSFGDVLLQQLAVVVQEGGYGVFCQDVIANLGLHHAKLFGDVFLGQRSQLDEQANLSVNCKSNPARSEC